MIDRLRAKQFLFFSPRAQNWGEGDRGQPDPCILFRADSESVSLWHEALSPDAFPSTWMCAQSAVAMVGSSCLASGPLQTLPNDGTLASHCHQFQCSLVYPNWEKGWVSWWLKWLWAPDFHSKLCHFCSSLWCPQAGHFPPLGLFPLLENLCVTWLDPGSEQSHGRERGFQTAECSKQVRRIPLVIRPLSSASARAHSALSPP